MPAQACSHARDSLPTPAPVYNRLRTTHSAKLYRVVNVQKWEVSSWGIHQPRLTRLDFPSKGSQGRLELTDTSRALQSPFICRGGRWSCMGEWSRSHQHPSVSLPNATGKRQTQKDPKAQLPRGLAQGCKHCLGSW